LEGGANGPVMRDPAAPGKSGEFFWPVAGLPKDCAPVGAAGMS
jgi:hypothetical protein